MNDVIEEQFRNRQQSLSKIVADNKLGQKEETFLYSALKECAILRQMISDAYNSCGCSMEESLSQALYQAALGKNVLDYLK